MLVRDVCSHSFNRIIIKTSPLFLVLPTLTMVGWGEGFGGREGSQDKDGETIGEKQTSQVYSGSHWGRRIYAFLHTDISRCLETNMIFETTSTIVLCIFALHEKGCSCHGQQFISLWSNCLWCCGTINIGNSSLLSEGGKFFTSSCHLCNLMPRMF